MFILMLITVILLSSFLAMIIFNLYKMWYEVSYQRYIDDKLVIIEVVMNSLSEKFDPEMFKYLGYLVGLEVSSESKYNIDWK